MNTRTLGGILLLAAAALTVWDGGIALPDLSPGPGPDAPRVEVSAEVESALKSGFSGKSEEAAVWAGMLHGMANFIEADSKTSKPMIDSVDDVAALIERSTMAPIRSLPSGSVIAGALQAELSSIGQSGDALTDNNRKKVILLFRGSAQVLEGL